MFNIGDRVVWSFLGFSNVGTLQAKRGMFGEEWSVMGDNGISFLAKESELTLLA